MSTFSDGAVPSTTLAPEPAQAGHAHGQTFAVQAETGVSLFSGCPCLERVAENLAFVAAKSVNLDDVIFGYSVDDRLHSPVSLEQIVSAATEAELEDLLLRGATHCGYDGGLPVAWSYWHYGRHAEYAEQTGHPLLSRLFSAAWQVRGRVLWACSEVDAEQERQAIRLEYEVGRLF